MSDQAEGDRSSARGEAAWKAAMQDVAERNRAARKAATARRAAFESQRLAARRGRPGSGTSRG